MKIALDAMGGDFAPERPVAAGVQALKMFPQIGKLYLLGDEPAIRTELQKHDISTVEARLEIRHCTQVIEMSDSPVDGIRKKKDNPISRSMDLIKDDLANAVVSAGHTGAMVAAATIKLRTLSGIDRPGIATIMPTETNLFVLIDAGANVDARPEHLVQYAIMGSVYSREVLKFPSPRVGLLGIGTEDVKGNANTKETFKLLRQAPINFVGNIEGHDVFERPVEVVVCDGFVGNVVLKTSESLAHAIFLWLKDELTKSPIRKLGAWLARNAFRAIKKKTNYEEYGGSLLLGVNGTCVIAHGSSTVKALVNAIRVAVEAVQSRVNSQIVDGVERLAAVVHE
ncbi:MAG: phosphate acyltransferase PlsX [Verrucomicrobiota bacterium]